MRARHRPKVLVATQTRVVEAVVDETGAAGHEFYVSQNGVWLTDTVPPTFIDFPD